MTYLFVYFIPPLATIYWWARPIPDFRWSLLSVFILMVGCILHANQLNKISLVSVGAAKWLVAYLFLSLIISFFAVDSDRSFERCYDFFRYIVVLLLIVKCLKTEAQLKHTVLLILLCGFFLGYQAYITPRHGGRLEGVGIPDAFDANGFALLLGTMAPLGLPALMSKNKWLIYSLPVSMVFILNAIILCNSRGSTLATFFAVCSIVWFTNITKFRIKMVFLGLLGACLFLYLADPVFLERIQTLKTSGKEDRGSGRLEVWEHGLEMLHDYPLGAGGDGFRILSPFYMPESLLTNKGVRAAHNTYLLVAVEQGYLGLAIYLGFLSHLFFLLKKGRKTIISKEGKYTIEQGQGDIFLYTMTIALEACLVGHMVGCIFTSRLYYEYIYVLGGISISVCYIIESKVIKTSHGS
jgi:hypothetical protein